MRPLLLLLLPACSPAVVNFDKGVVDSGDTGDTGTAPVPLLVLSTELLDLGYGAVDQTLSGTFTVQNAGDATLNVALSLTDGDPHFVMDATTVDIEPLAEVVYTVTFSADTVGSYGGSVAVLTNDVDVAVALLAVVADDTDGDGYVEGDDCNDDDATINPGAEDTPYDGVDTDCSGTSDYDADGDGDDAADYGGGDCDDADASVSSLATETYYDGVDQNCDNRSDFDADQDGHDAQDYGGEDCDDTDANAYPGNLEDEGDGVDNDCDGLTDETPSTTDEDGDGYSEATGDCNDADVTISPDAVEIWYDGIDQDCDGESDYDQDADGYEVDTFGGDDCDDTAATVNPAATDTPYDGIDRDCSGGSDYDADADGYDATAYGGTDCNDRDAAINPTARETWYDGVDQNCDGASDYDQDGDGQRASGYSGTDCDDLDPSIYVGAVEVWYDGVDSNCAGDDDYDQDGDGYASDAYGGDDCDDTISAVNPGAGEAWYDGIDQDCDGASDYDRDGDGYDSETYGGEDCVDTDASVYPGASEVWYDGIDGNCDGASDYDQDGDGIVTGANDCDDTDATVYRGATEICDGVDNDCDGFTDETAPTWYDDDDSDGYGNPDVSITACTAPSGYIIDNTDCDDTNAAINPAASEVSYNAADDDCDGMQDNMYAVDESDWRVIGTSASHGAGAVPAGMYADEDGDGYAELAVAAQGDDTGGSNAGAIAWHDLATRGTLVNFSSGYLTIYGESAGDQFGVGLTYFDDYDGDSGESEFMAGAPYDDDDATDGGAVYLFDLYGSSWLTGSQRIDTVDQVKITGTSGNGYFGASVAAGDVDGDGYADALVGAPGRSSNRGQVFVFVAAEYYWYSWYGIQNIEDDSEATASIRGVSSGDSFGTAMATADTDGDGDDDILICAPGYDNGSTATDVGGCWLVDPDYVSAYTTNTVTSVDDAQIRGVATSDALGQTVNSAAMGDIDGDGYADVVVGAPGYDGSETDGGVAAVFLAGTLSGSLTLTSADTRLCGDGGLGTSVLVTDIAGSTGVITGAPAGGSGGQGILYAVSSKTAQAGGLIDLTESAYGSWLGEVNGDSFGATAVGGMDVDGDGTNDVASGASGWDSGATSAAGKLYVLPLW